MSNVRKILDTTVTDVGFGPRLPNGRHTGSKKRVSKPSATEF